MFQNRTEATITAPMPRNRPWLVRCSLILLITVSAASRSQSAPTDAKISSDDSIDASGAELVQATGCQGGLIVYLDSGSANEFARLATALQADDRFVVQGLYAGQDKIATVRDELTKQTRYGAVSVTRLQGSQLPYADNLVNLFISGDQMDVTDSEIQRVMAPGGVVLRRRGEHYVSQVNPRPAAIDDWTHLLYDAGNNAVSNDTAVGPPHHVQWIAPPLNARHHESLGTVTVAVSATGRLFYIIDEAPAASILLPAEWKVVARDAFNGVKLWKRSIPKWENYRRAFRDGPPELSRTLVATNRHVYVTLGQRAAVSALDPATGQTMKRYEATVGTEEIVVLDGVLYLVVRQTNGERAGQRKLLAVDCQSGDLLWQRPATSILPLSLAVAEDQVIYVTSQAVHCLNASNGKSIWSTKRVAPEKRPGWSTATVVLRDGVVLVADRWPEYPGTKDEVTGKPVARWLAQEGWTGDLIAYSAANGQELWKCRCAETYHAPPDVFFADGLVWVGQSRSRTGPDFVAGRDLHTGEIRRRLDTAEAFETTMPHHRCHRNRATQNYIIAGRTGVEFIDLQTGDARRHHWTRGTCQFGVLPCNGLLYVPPHSCACYIEAKMTGFLSLAPRRTENDTEVVSTPTERLQRGPAYSTFVQPRDSASRSTASREDWPTYRSDAIRSACTPQQLPAEIGQIWNVDLGSRVTSPVIAEQKLFVATTNTHTVHALDASTGKSCWSFVAGGRIDSPPTIADGRVVFGTADGHVYCLSSADGQLIWQFQAARNLRQIMAFGQLESPWPVHGSVLVHQGSVFFVAGRSSFLDHGMKMYRLDLTTGQVIAHRTLYDRDPITGQQPDEPTMFEMPGALPDILSTDGELIYMRQAAFALDTLESRPTKKHVFSPAGFLNGDWWHRSYWIDGTHFYSGYIGWYFAGRETPAGRLLTFSDSKLYGYGYVPRDYRGATGRTYHLFSLDRSAQPPQPAADYQRANRDYAPRRPGKFRISYDWTQDVSLLARCLLLSKDKLFAVGPPKQALTVSRAFQGAEGARLTVVSTKDGSVLKQYHLASLPAYDGLAAADHRLYLSLQDGQVLCLGAGGTATRNIRPIKPLAQRLPPLEKAPQPGLTGYWKLDEGEGDLARDSSGQGRTGKTNRDWTTDSSGTCLRTGGSAAALTLPDGPYLHPGTDSFTVQLWATIQQHDCRLLGKEDFPRNWWVVNILATGRAELVLGCGKESGRQVRAVSHGSLPTQSWFHLAYVIDRQQDTVRCYLNGQPAGATTIPASLKNASFDVPGVDLLIPAMHKPFDGLIDEVQFHQRALTAQDIQASYDRTSSGRGRGSNEPGK